MQNKNKMIPMLVSMGLCVAALTSGVAYYSAHRIKDNLPKDTAQAKPQAEISSPVTAPQTPTLDVAKQERAQQKESQKQVQPDSDAKTKTETKSQEAPSAERKPAPKTTEVTFCWPVQGEVVLPYSKDKAVYDPTLEQYRTNDTLCIAAPVNTKVAAAADGIVKEIKDDPENGRTVMIEHSNGWRTTYGPLQKEGLPEKDASVTQGQTIGTVDHPTKYRSKLGEHLSFGITKDGQSVDPQTKLEK